ncbi:MAG: glycosyltransferase, partial [Candidatus Hodarchaeota archaeon]
MIQKNKLKILFVIEEKLDILDEGKKNISFNLLKIISKASFVDIFVRKNNQAITGYEFDKNLKSFWRDIIGPLKKNKKEYDYIFYFPQGSILNYRSQFFSKLIQKKCKKYNQKIKLVFFSFQEKEDSFTRLIWLKLFKPDKLVCLVNSSSKIEKIIGKKNIIKTYPGVDINKFFPVSDRVKNELRRKYNIPLDKKVVLHVGHATQTRGLDDLINLAKKNKDFFSLIITSSLYESDWLIEFIGNLDNIRIISDYVSDIDEFYKLSDLYIFPAKNKNTAIDFP